MRKYLAAMHMAGQNGIKGAGNILTSNHLRSFMKCVVAGSDSRPFNALMQAEQAKFSLHRRIIAFAQELSKTVANPPDERKARDTYPRSGQIQRDRARPMEDVQVWSCGCQMKWDPRPFVVTGN